MTFSKPMVRCKRSTASYNFLFLLLVSKKVNTTDNGGSTTIQLFFILLSFGFIHHSFLLPNAQGNWELLLNFHSMKFYFKFIHFIFTISNKNSITLIL